MAWLDDDYTQRKAFNVNATTGAGSVDVQLTIPTGWDAFWDAIDSNGYGVRFTGPDGVTELDYQLSSWTYASRTAVYQIDDMPLASTADTCVLVWIYFAPQATATDGSTSFTPGTLAPAVMELGEPDPASAIPLRSQTPGESAPADRIAKSTAEVRDLFLDVTSAMQPASGRYNGRRLWEEPGVASVDVLDSGGSSVASMNEASAMRWVSVERGNGRQRLYLRVRVKAGTDATNYTLSTTILTATPLSSPTYRTLPMRVGVQVLDQLES